MAQIKKNCFDYFHNCFETNINVSEYVEDK